MPSSDFRRITFSGYDWKVTSGIGRKPGPNNWLDSSDHVWVDDNRRLHLRITYRDGRWYAAEVGMVQALGYGQYTFYVASRVDLLDKNIVAGLFVYQDDRNEIDIEFSRWGGLGANSQYVVQPGPYTDRNLYRFNAQLKGDNSTHRFIWTSNSITFRSLHGHYSEPPNSDYLITKWNYGGSYIPTPDVARLLINFWLFRGAPPYDAKEAELVIAKFEFVPEGMPQRTGVSSIKQLSSCSL